MYVQYSYTISYTIETTIHKYYDRLKSRNDHDRLSREYLSIIGQLLHEWKCVVSYHMDIKCCENDPKSDMRNIK